MAKTKRKAGKRTTADRAGLRARKSAVSKARKPGLRKPKPAKTDSGKRKPSLQPEIARLKRQLKAAQMQREASAEILRAVANASGDAAGPLQLIAETTAGLFKASSVSIQLAEGSEFTQEYRVGAIAKRIGSAYPRSIIKVGGRNLPGTVVAENRQIHIPDLDQLDPSMSDFPGLPHARAGGARTVCGTPLRREHGAIGALIVFRDRLLPFTDDELSLLQSFADQAVIAIRNARLFNETREALERQVATADILRIISRSVAHAAPVFDTILESCQRLFNPFDAAVYLVEGDRVRGVARRGPGVGDWGTDSMPLAGSSTGLAIAQRRPLHFPDLADKAGLPEDKRDAVRLAGGMSVLYAPIISESRGVGSLVVTRQPKNPFTETEIEFIQSFADQAAIAIENARLFNETKAALEQQTATAEILSVMSSSPTDVTPVFEAIAERARELSGSRIGSAVRFDGELLHMIAFRGSSPEAEAAMHAAFPMKPGNGSLNARVIAGLVPLQIPDIDLDPAYQLGDVAKKGDYRALLAVPMIHDGRAIGAIGIGRDEPGLFPEKIVTLLQTFASQAVIAIENVRLFNETREALQQQIATADVLKVISRTAFDLDSVMHTLATSAAELCAAGLCGLYIREGDFLVCRGYTAAISKEQADFVRQARIPAFDPNFAATRVLSSGEVANIGDFENDRSVATQAFREKLGFKSLLIVPLMREGQGIGLFILGRDRVGQFSPRHVELVQTFADQAVIAIENARLFDEVQARTSDLSEALEQQTATSEVLAVISGSPSDLNPVLKAISDTAARLCGSEQTMFFRYDGSVFRILASWNFPPEVHEMLERRPLMPGHPSAIGRAGASLKPVCIPDVLADPAYGLTGEQSRARYRATLAVPLLREGQLIGALSLNRSEPGAFTEKQIELVATFADQAVIAIENTRLFNETKEALERQAATSDILRVISRSPTDVQPVFDAIVLTAVRLIGCDQAFFLRCDGATYLQMARATPEGLQTIARPPQHIDPDANFPARAIVEKKTLHLPDWSLVDLPVKERWVHETFGIVSSLYLPLLRAGECIGLLVLAGKRTNIFGEREIALAESFRDQAVIAIENVRLFDEVQAKTSDLEESLQQQIATADVLKVISRSAFDLQTVLETLARSAVELSSARRGTVFLRDGDVFRFRAASHSDLSEDWTRFMKDHPQQAGRHSTIGRAIASARSVCTPDVDADPEIMMPTYLAGIRAVLAVPLLRDGKVEGVMALSRQEPGEFTARQIELVETFADQAVIAIENTRLFNETRQALAYQTGSSNVLRVIASSPTDVEPVLKEIVESARELCEANDAVVLLKDAEHLRFSAHSGPIPVTLDKWPISRNWTAGRALVDRKPVHVHDMLSGDGAEFPDARAMGQSTGSTIRTVLSVPLLRGNESIGAILLRRTEVRPFNDKQINLLSTFADQAVIAIQNARLFNETKEALERQTATADILKVIASSPSDLQPVFEAIAERSNRLVSGLSTTVLSIVDDTIHLSAFTRTNPEADAALTASFPRQLSAMPFGEPIRRGAIYSLPDTETEPVLRDLARMRGYRSMLFVPLLRDGAPIGMIGQTRVEPGPFAVNHIQLLKTFADQAVIAISNVRLFQEVRERTRELSQSLDDLRTAQDRLVQTEKLASLGQLTAGIAHEIKNPLNFVNNFSALSVELIDEMTEIFENPALDEAGRRKELDEIRELLKGNLEKVVQHGKRADSIVKNMLLHSREGSGEQRAVDINALLDESLNLAYHGARAEKPGFNITLQRDLDPDAGVIELFPQEITRALLNLISNGFYAASKREAENGEADFEPMLSAATRNLGNHIEIRIRDNGTGIPPEVKEKMFNPFFTTKPAGEGTGLGLSMSHDIIVKQHGGRIEMDTQPGQFTEFTIVLPRAQDS